MIKAIRNKIGLSQSQIGSALGCHQSDISRIERGEVTPDWLIKFAVLLKMLKDAGLSYEDIVMEFPAPAATDPTTAGEYKTQ